MTVVEAKPKQEVFTLEEIDNNLATLANVRKYSLSANKKTLDKRINIWLDRRLEIQEAGDN